MSKQRRSPEAIIIALQRGLFQPRTPRCVLVREDHRPWRKARGHQLSEVEKLPCCWRREGWL